jgi:acetyl-CoA carboxylase beta subunit
LNIRQCSSNSNLEKEIEILDKSWKKSEDMLNEQKRINDSLYTINKESIIKDTKEYDSLKVNNKKKFQKKITTSKKKYDKEYTSVSGTAIDGTLIISREQLSKDIDYSKFKR